MPRIGQNIYDRVNFIFKAFALSLPDVATSVTLEKQVMDFMNCMLFNEDKINQEAIDAFNEDGIVVMIHKVERRDHSEYFEVTAITKHKTVRWEYENMWKPFGRVANPQS
jgi:hypothetical protein